MLHHIWNADTGADRNCFHAIYVWRFVWRRGNGDPRANPYADHDGRPHTAMDSTRQFDDRRSVLYDLTSQFGWRGNADADQNAYKDPDRNPGMYDE